MSAEMQPLNELTGSFLSVDQDAAGQLRTAATKPFPASVKLLLESHDIAPPEIAAVLMLERDTAKGFWRVALGALLLAHLEKKELPVAPEEVQNSIGEIFHLAKNNIPELLARQEFLRYCASAMKRVEAQIEAQSSASDEDEGQPATRATSLPRRISQSGMLPSIRYSSNGYAYACMNYSLLDDNNVTLLEDEFGVEDMLFLAESAVSSSKGALMSALQVIKEGQLVRHNDEQTLRARKNAIEEDLQELLDLLLSLKEVPEQSR